jgi:hypothetical protein
MTFALYLRVENSVGGIGCTDKQFIQACHDYIFIHQARRHNIYRKARHAFIREGLWRLYGARDLAFEDLLKDMHKNNCKDMPPCEGELKQAWHLNEISKYGGMI